MPYSRNSSYFVFQIFLKKRDLIIKKLKEKNIGISIHYLNPIHKMSYYKYKYNLKSNILKNTHEYASTSISLPVYPKLKFSEIDYITKIIKDIISK